MKKYNFKQPFKDAFGIEVKNMTIGKALAELLGSETEGKVARLYGWYLSLIQRDELELADADVEEIKDIIEKNKRSYIFAKGQMLSCLK